MICSSPAFVTRDSIVFSGQCIEYKSSTSVSHHRASSDTTPLTTPNGYRFRNSVLNCFYTSWPQVSEATSTSDEAALACPYPASCRS